MGTVLTAAEIDKNNKNNMNEHIITKRFDLGDGRMIEIETGKLAKQADGAAVVRMNDTMLLATVCSKKEVGENVDFMPLTVDYQEKYAAMGRFPGGFFKREARPSEHEILIARLVDRALRPLFPDNFHAEVQVNITLISGDKDTMPDQLAALAAASALAVSDIPFNGPVSEVRVSYLDGKYVINTPMEDIERADLDLIVAATADNIMMVEGEMKEVGEEVMLNALKAAHEAIKIQCRVLDELTIEAGKTEKREYCHEVNDEELRQRVRDAVYQKCYDFSKQGIANKHQREDGFAAIKQEFIDANYTEETLTDEIKFMIDRYYHDTPSGARPTTCLRLTVAPSLPAARPSPSAPAPLAPSSTSRRSMVPSSRACAVSCCTTTSPASPPARSNAPAAPAAARWVTATWPGAPSKRSCPPRRSAPTPSAWYPISSNPTAPALWPPSAPVAWR